VERNGRTELAVKIVALLLVWGGVAAYKYTAFPASIAGAVMVALGSIMLVLRLRTSAGNPAEPVVATAEGASSERVRASPTHFVAAVMSDRSAHDLLEHVPFMALSVGPDHRVGLGGASRLAEELLGGGASIVGERFADLVVREPDAAENRKLLNEWFQLIFEKPDQDWDTVLELCPVDTIKVARDDGLESEFRLHYHAMRAGKGGPVVRVLVVGTDVTHERALAKELETRNRDDEASVKRFAEVLKLGAETFRRFLNESQTRLSEASGAVEALERNAHDTEALRTLLRQMHTLKANARALRLDWVATAAAQAEDALAVLRDTECPGEHPTFEGALQRIDAMRAILDDTEALGTSVFGRSLDPGEVRARERDLEVPVRVGRLETALALVRAARSLVSAANPTAASFLAKTEVSLDGLRNVPARNLFQRFPKMVADLAAVMGKRVNPLRVVGSDTMLNVRTLDRVGDALVHLLRNAVAHGVEASDVRAAADKAAAGTIELVLRHEADRLVFEVIDDGAGVDFEVVRRTAVEAKMVSAEEAASLAQERLTEFLFTPGFSTLPLANDSAGRGIGLDMVKAATEFLGGALAFETRRGVGTTVRLSIPDRWPC
jgi:signal transduction histidine kinase